MFIRCFGVADERKLLGAQVRAVLVAMAMVLWLAGPSVALAEDFESRFGGEFRQVRATSEFDDDLALAVTVIEVARDEAATEPTLATELAERAYMIAMGDPAGHAAAVAAMDLLTEIEPAQRRMYQRRAVTAVERAHQRGRGVVKDQAGDAWLELIKRYAHEAMQRGEYQEAEGLWRDAMGAARKLRSPQQSLLQSRINECRRLVRVQTTIGRLKAKLAEAPESATLHRELLDAYLVDMNDAVAAMDHLELGGDEATKTYLPLLTRPANALTSDELLGLADWHRTYAEQFNNERQARLLIGAIKYYEHHLGGYLDDEARRQVEARRDEADKALAAALKATGGDARVFDLLRGIDLKQDQLQLFLEVPGEADWRQTDAWRGLSTGRLTNREARVYLRMPISVQGSYKMAVHLRGTQGVMKFGLPVGDGMISFSLQIYGEGMLVHKNTALELPHGHKQELQRGELAPGEGHFAFTVLVDGDDVLFVADLRDQRVLRWSGKVSDLAGHRPDWLPPTASTATPALFQFGGAQMHIEAVQLMLLAGEAAPIR